MSDNNSPIDVYYDMDIAQICAHFGKSRNTVDKAVAKLVRNYPNEGWKYKNPETRRITIKAQGVEVLSTYFRKEKHEVSTIETELRMENEKLAAILQEREKTIENLESVYRQRLNLELDRTRQTFLIEQKSKDDQIAQQETRIQELESENQKSEQSYKEEIQNLKEKEEELRKREEEYRKKEEEYNSKSFFYRMTHKFSLS